MYFYILNGMLEVVFAFLELYCFIGPGSNIDDIKTAKIVLKHSPIWRSRNEQQSNHYLKFDRLTPLLTNVCQFPSFENV